MIKEMTRVIGSLMSPFYKDQVLLTPGELSKFRLIESVLAVGIANISNSRDRNVLGQGFKSVILTRIIYDTVHDVSCSNESVAEEKQLGLLDIGFVLAFAGSLESASSIWLSISKQMLTLFACYRAIQARKINVSYN